MYGCMNITSLPCVFSTSIPMEQMLVHCPVVTINGTLLDSRSSAYRSISSVHMNICTVDEYYGLDTCCWSHWWRSPNRHYRSEAHVDASAILVVFPVFLFVGRNSIPKLSALRIHYRLHPVGSNRDRSDWNPPDNPLGNCLSMFRFSIVAVLCWHPWLGPSRMGQSGSY